MISGIFKFIQGVVRIRGSDGNVAAVSSTGALKTEPSQDWKEDILLNRVLLDNILHELKLLNMKVSEGFDLEDEL